MAVGISAGVGALVSALPVLQPHMLSLCLIILAMITLINLRGVRESGAAFMIPTYLFIVSLLSVLAIGVVKSLLAGGRPVAVEPPAAQVPTEIKASVWILMRAFASGCTAMTGVEAVSNGVTAFREPAVRHATRTLTAIIALLGLMLAGIAYLCGVYGIGATEPGALGYQSTLSQLTAAVIGRGFFYYVTIGSVLVVLALSANTGFADFPRLCRVIAQDGYLPSGFAHRGRRLVYSQGILVLAGLSGGILAAFGGITDHLIPLFAVGAFLAFTLSQAGMVAHWKRLRGDHWRKSMVINAAGAISTGVTLVVVLVSKFLEGAWVMCLLVPGLLFVFYEVKIHYRKIGRELATDEPLDAEGLSAPVVLLPMRGWSMITRKALHFALKISHEIYALHIAGDEQTMVALEDGWNRLVREPAQEAGLPAPKLIIVYSPFRQLYRPLIEVVTDLSKAHPDRDIAVIIPELIGTKWYHYILHNQTAAVMVAYLRMSGFRRVVVINVPWYPEH
jgi:amino acid transporter